MLTLVIFIAVLAVLVLTHEWGHFIVARRSGVKVHEFGFGFPPRLFGVRRYQENGKSRWQFTWGKDKDLSAKTAPTLYSVNLIPLGGFVRIKGEDAASADAHDPDSFTSQHWLRRAGILAAGVFMNVVTAAALLSFGYWIGMPQAVSEGAPAQGPTNLQIVHVAAGSPAELAGLRSGDVVVQADSVAQPTLVQFQKYIADHKDTPVAMAVRRGESLVALTIIPQFNSELERSVIGVSLTEIQIVSYPWYAAIGRGIEATGRMFVEIFKAFGVLFGGLFKGQGISADVAGPVGVAVMTGEAARLGFAYLIQFTALLSLNLAVLNILPIPALDGGRLFLMAVRALWRSPRAAKAEQWAHAIGFMALMALVVVITVNDIRDFGGVFLSWWDAR